MKIRCLALLLSLLMLITFLPAAAHAQQAAAEDISGAGIVTDHGGIPSINALFDGKLLSGKVANADAFLTLEHDKGIGSLYFLFDAPSGGYTITDNKTGITVNAGENGFIHDFVDLSAYFEATPTSITVRFPQEGVRIFELFVYTPGEVPETVQKWQTPADEKTDLLLFSTHGDDEQLFFAGVLPYYAGQLGYQVQVVYMTDHREKDPHRMHEMLNGLWAVGVTAYPVAGSYPDFLIKHDMAATYSTFAVYGHSREDMLGFVVENLRRFKPKVAIGHDINGEYGHGMHMVYTDLLMEAVTITNDAGYYPESAEKYGLWDTPKTYLHLYKENEIVMDWDVPLERFGGMTAFEVTQQLGYPCHVSQFQDFAWYHYAAKTAKDVVKYSPCNYGLYRSTVGPDTAKNDFFENILTHSQQAQAEEEARLEAERLEAERLAAEEEARRLEAQQQEAARLAEEARLAQELKLAEEARLLQKQQQKNMLLAAAAGVLILLVSVFLIFRKKKH